MTQRRPITWTEILLGAFPAVAFALSVASVMAGCGVKQYGAKLAKALKPSATPMTAEGPFYSSGQSAGAMSPASCAPGAGHHPCVRAQVSVGMPYQFDVNANDTQGPIVSGASYGAPGNSYPGAAGAGRSSASAGRPRLENRDLKLMERQATGNN